MITDIIVIVIIALIVGGSAFYIIKEKKKGKKCIGCPYCNSCLKGSKGGCDTKK